MGARLASAARFVWIGVVVLTSLLVYLLLRLPTLLILARRRRRSAVARLRGRVLRRTMEVLGATFIKLGQVMSARPDLFPGEMIDELRKLQDSVRPFHYRKAIALIEAELERPIDECFSSFDHQPIAAASVAQVHRAELANGAEVAVKVLRPRVREQVRRDGEILISIAKVACLSRAARLSDPVGHMEHFVEGILSQTDLRNEARNNVIFRANFVDEDDVIFPEVIETLSGEGVMTMEFVRGRKIDRLEEGIHSEIGLLCRKVFFRMCFEHGFVHADLHPGNMLITDDNKLAIFDVGLVKKLEGEVLDQFIDFARCMAMGTSDDLVEHMRRFHTYLEDTDWDALERDLAAILDKFRGQSAGDLEIGVFINDMFTLARNHHARPVAEVTLVLVGVVTAEGISKMLDPDVDSFAEMARFLAPLLAERQARAG